MKWLTALLLMLSLALPAEAWSTLRADAGNHLATCETPASGGPVMSDCCAPKPAATAKPAATPATARCCCAAPQAPSTPPAPRAPLDSNPGKVAAAVPPREFTSPQLPPPPARVVFFLTSLDRKTPARAFAVSARPCAVRCSFRI